jgi:HD-like signal output (HDOD) protein
MVNSAYYGLQAQVRSLTQAINLLGLDTVKNLVLAAGVFKQFSGLTVSGYSIDGIYDNSMKVGKNAKTVSTAFGFTPGKVEEASTAGMLYDIGKLILISHFATELKDSSELSKGKSIPLCQAEKEILGASDAEIGAYLLSLWGLPDSIVEAVALHYTPGETSEPMLNVLTAVHIAYALEQTMGSDANPPEYSIFDTEYLSKLGISKEIEQLRNLCACISWQ